MARSFPLPLVLSLAAAVLLGAPAHALESSWTEAGHSTTRLVADAANGKARAGVEIRLENGWKTYWRYPGDAGVPPRFDWSGSENLAAAEIHWPAPQLFVDDSGSKSIGYRDGVIFPVSIKPLDPTQPVRLKLKLDFAVCEKLCVPAEARMALLVPPGAARSERLQQALARVPRRVALDAGGALKIDKVTIKRGAGPQAIVEVKAPAGSTPQLFAEGPDDRWALPLPVPIAPANGRARFALDLAGAPPGAPPIPPALKLTAVAAGDAVEVAIPLE